MDTSKFRKILEEFPWLADLFSQIDGPCRFGDLLRGQCPTCHSLGINVRPIAMDVLTKRLFHHEEDTLSEIRTAQTLFVVSRNVVTKVDLASVNISPYQLKIEDGHYAGVDETMAKDFDAMDEEASICQAESPRDATRLYLLAIARRRELWEDYHNPASELPPRIHQVLTGDEEYVVIVTHNQWVHDFMTYWVKEVTICCQPVEGMLRKMLEGELPRGEVAVCSGQPS